VALVTRRWDNGFTQVDEQWLNRAIELVREHGVVSTQPARILEVEMGIPAHSDMIGRLQVIAGNETVHERNANLALTEAEGVERYMKLSANNDDWNRRAETVKAANGGRYPIFWGAVIVASGLAERVMGSSANMTVTYSSRTQERIDKQPESKKKWWKFGR
jgi:hypothetical protein